MISRRRFLVGLGALSVLVPSGISNAYPDYLSSSGFDYEYLLGDAKIGIKVYENGPGITYVCPHDSENTGVKVATAIVKRHGGRLLQLVHSGQRNISFNHNGIKYAFDPNRMFSDKGLKRTLQDQGGTYSKEAHDMVSSFAFVFIAHCELGQRGSRPLVAVHNNTDGSYSLTSYANGGDMAHEARDVAVAPGTDTDDFFFVTNTSDFKKFRDAGFNVAQQSSHPTEDGSLSVYCGKKGIRYINVEAQAGHSVAQKKMLEALYG